MARPAFRRNAAGTLTFDVPEGTPTFPSVRIFDESGTEDTANTYTPSVVGNSLTVALPAALLDNWGDNYRAAWTYTVSATTYYRNQTFECVGSVLYPTLTTSKWTQRYAGLLAGRIPPSQTGSMTQQAALDTGWDLLLDFVTTATGRSAHLVIDPAPLERAHAHFAAYVMASNLAPGRADTDTFQAWAAEQRTAAEREATNALRVCRWYDRNQDLLPSGGSSVAGFLWYDSAGNPVAANGLEQNANTIQPRFYR